MTVIRHLEFYGSNNWYFEKPCQSSINADVIVLISFSENRVLATDRQTEKQMDSIDA